MPGHLKKSDGPDPDPSPWLIVSPELKEKLKSKPLFWIHDIRHQYCTETLQCQ